MLTLRKPQHEALVDTKAAYDEGLRRLLIVLPTGVGKTPTFAALRSFFGFTKKVMVLVDRDQLATQAANQIKKWNPDEQVGIEMAERRCSPDDTFIVASVPTLDGSHRLEQFDPAEFDCVICDEAHHSVSPSWKRVLSHFGFFEDDFGEAGGDILLVGVTATPGRGDNQAMGQVYEKISYVYSLLDAVRDGWLVVPRGYRVDTGADFTHLRLKRRSDGEVDFSTNEVAEIVDTLKGNEATVRAYQKYGENGKAIVFGVDINHCKNLAIAFNREGVPALPVWGTDPERDEKFAAHRNNHVRVLVNVNLCTEGYDDPEVSVVVNDAPTNSQLRYIQRCGRAFRLQDGINNLHEARKAGVYPLKEHGIVIDMVGSSEKHSLASLPTIFGLPPNLDLEGGDVLEAVEMVEEYEQKYPDIDFSALTNLQLIDVHAQSVDLFSAKLPHGLLETSPLNWYRTVDGAYILRIPPNEYVEVAKSLRGDWIAHGSVSKNHFTKDGWTSMEAAIQFADQMVSMYGRGLMDQLRRNNPRMRKPASPAQLNLLRRLTPDHLKNQIPAKLTKAEAQQAINRLIRQQVMASAKVKR